jgi:hypothetical protein
MKTKLLLILALSLVGSAAAGAEDHEAHAHPPAADPRFEFLKRLAGTWVGTLGGADGGDHSVEFRVTAGGHAIEEREMVGTPMEIVTLYHLEGKDLVANHYCMLGNRPRLTAAEQVVDDALTFACDGRPGNTRSHDEEHVHAWTIRNDRDGRLTYTAELRKEGRVTETHEVALARRIEKASR